MPLSRDAEGKPRPSSVSSATDDASLGRRRPAAWRAAMLSVAFFSTLVSAWRHSRPSHSKYTGLVRRMRSRRRSADWPTRCRNTACCDQLLRILAPHDGRGHAREGRELVHHAADVADLADDRVRALLEHFRIGRRPRRAYLRFSRSAESWIGVSGFLISWAMRRATSAQAAVRWAETRSVMSSKVDDKAAGMAAALARDLHAQRACACRRA